MPPPGVPRPPTAQTLARYGLTADEWRAMCRRVKYTCVVCGKPFGDRPLVIDHEHVKGWRARKTKKAKRGGKSIKVRVMTPSERKRYVRGVLHSYCNRFVRSWLTLDRARAIAAYLEAYHESKERS